MFYAKDNINSIRLNFVSLLVAEIFEKIRTCNKNYSYLKCIILNVLSVSSVLCRKQLDHAPEKYKPLKNIMLIKSFVRTIYI